MAEVYEDFGGTNVLFDPATLGDYPAIPTQIDDYDGTSVETIISDNSSATWEMGSGKPTAG